jgi:hypothetical protein
MILSDLSALILQARCIAVRYQPIQLHRLSKQELTTLYELAKKKTEFVEKNSNYHPADFRVHKDNELLLQTILERKQQ